MNRGGESPVIGLLAEFVGWLLVLTDEAPARELTHLVGAVDLLSDDSWKIEVTMDDVVLMGVGKSPSDVNYIPKDTVYVVFRDHFQAWEVSKPHRRYEGVHVLGYLDFRIFLSRGFISEVMMALMACHITLVVSKLEWKLVVVQNKITYRINVVFDHNEAITVKEVLSWDLWLQIHPVFHKVYIVDQHILVQLILPWVLPHTLSVHVYEVLKLKSVNWELFEHKFSISKFKAGDNNGFCWNHMVNLVMLEEINVDILDVFGFNWVIVVRAYRVASVACAYSFPHHLAVKQSWWQAFLYESMSFGVCSIFQFLLH